MHNASRRQFLISGAKAAAVSLLPGFVHAQTLSYASSQLNTSMRIPPRGPSKVPNLGYISGEHSLKAHAAARRMLFGCGVDVDRLRNESAYAALVTSQSDVLTAENSMKMNVLRPSPNEYAFDASDWLVTFCEKNRIKLRGHVLVWDKALPAWFGQVANQQNARQILTEHVQNVVGRYQGRMHSWDVVNEAIDLGSGRVDSLRLSPWLQLAGQDYIELAFRTARDADPTALLCYNEFGIELETQEHENKRAMVLLMLRRLRSRQVPVDALGIQSHLGPVAKGAYGYGLMRFMATVREMGMQIFISEMDVNDQMLPANNGQRDQIVAATYSSYLDQVLQEPAVTVVQTWGLTDRYSWMNEMPQSNRADRLPSRPLLFDDEYRMKPAFDAVRAAFDHKQSLAGTRPSTLQLPTDPNSPFRSQPQPYLPAPELRPHTQY